MLWSLSIWIESLAILPQIFVIPKTNIPENKKIHYILILQSGYRAFYLVNWVIRFHFERYSDPIAWAAGVVQVFLSAVALQHLITSRKVAPTVLDPSGKGPLQILFLLRFVQLGATVISGYIWCNLVWSHNNHYCAWYPRTCTDEQKQSVKVPWQFIVMIAAVSLSMKSINASQCVSAFLESFVSTAACLHWQTVPNYFNLLCSTSAVALLYLIGYFSVLGVGGVSYWCNFLSTPMDLRANVEERLCVLVINGRVITQVALYDPSLTLTYQSQCLYNWHFVFIGAGSCIERGDKNHLDG